MGQESGVKQISSKFNIPEKEVMDMGHRLSHRDTSLDQPLSSQEGTTSLIEFQTNQNKENTLDHQISRNEELNLLMKNIDQLRPELNEREVFLLENRLLSEQPMTLQEIGEKYGVTREAVRQLEARLIKKIKVRLKVLLQA